MPRPTERHIHPDRGAGRGSTHAGHSVGNYAEQWLYQWQDPGKSKAFVVTEKYLVICWLAKADITLRLQKAAPQMVNKASHSQPTVPFPSWVLPPRNQNSSVSMVTKQRFWGPTNLGTNCHLLHTIETNIGSYTASYSLGTVASVPGDKLTGVWCQPLLPRLRTVGIKTSYRIWCHIIGWVIPDISKDDVTSIFKSKQSKHYSQHRNIALYLHSTSPYISRCGT